jgi:3-dehydroquinate dehydratase I
LKSSSSQQRTGGTKVSKATKTVRMGPPPGLLPLLSRERPLIVGTLHEPTGLKSALSRSGHPLKGIDLLEARLDHLEGLPLPSSWPLPVIATARHPSEGGAGGLSASRRRELLLGALPWASALDIELRSAGTMASLIAETHSAGRTVILSHHDFRKTPGATTLRDLARRAESEGADLFKVAVTLRDRADLLRLLDFQSSALPIPVAAMGMGTAGRFSRIVLAGFGSPLCYGWLGKPQVSGQWPALSLRSVMDQVLPA